MAESNRRIVIGTRGSALARWQTDHVAELLRSAWPGLHVESRVFTTEGDRVLDKPLAKIGGKGLFTEELENALRLGEIDLAVHSLKDLPTENPAGLTIGATPERETVVDAIISRGRQTLDALPRGATVGTSSRRRAAQILAHRPDLTIADVRGNVDTRIRKALDPQGPYDAVVLAAAGLTRLGFLHMAVELLPVKVMLPAPGQGALAIQCRDERDSLALLAPLNHNETRFAVTAERAFLAGLGGGCALPIAALGTIEDGILTLRGRVTSPDGRSSVDVTGRTQPSEESAAELGRELATEALSKGADKLLEALR